MVKYCTNCGGQLPNGVKFCLFCGQAIQQPQQQAPTAQPPPVQQQPYIQLEIQQQPVQPQYQQQPVPPQYHQPVQPQYPQPYPFAPVPAKKNNKTPFIIAGVGGLAVIVLVVVLIATSGFGLWDKTGDDSGDSNIVSGVNMTPGNTGNSSTQKTGDDSGDSSIVSGVNVTPGNTGNSSAQNAATELTQIEITDLPSYTSAYIAVLTEYYDQGRELSKIGLFLQSYWFYSFAEASAGAMRCFLDKMITLKGGVVPPVDEPRHNDWEQIGLINQASPFPYMYESFSLSAEGKTVEADAAWENAMINPLMFEEFAGDAAIFLDADISQLTEARDAVAVFEDMLFEVYVSSERYYERDPNGWDSNYYYELGKEALREDGEDYGGAMAYFEAALTVDPFNGNLFNACAIISLYTGESEMMFYYLNEGLRVDPEHPGLSTLQDAIRTASDQ